MKDRTRVKEVWSGSGDSKSLDKKLNDWLEENDQIYEVIDIKYSMSIAEEDSSSSALVIFKLKEAA